MFSWHVLKNKKPKTFNMKMFVLEKPKEFMIYKNNKTSKNRI